MIQIYTIPSCFHCATAKKRLKDANIEYEELDGITNLDLLLSLNQYSMPVIMKEGKVISLDDAINYEK
jgi:glutaredoxin